MNTTRPYDPYRIRVRVRPLSPRKALVLYLWQMAWLIAIGFAAAETFR